MVKVDVIAALDMHVERGEWEKCIQTAEQAVRCHELKLIFPPFVKQFYCSIEIVVFTL